jgi:hypothetical protein
LEIYVAFIAEGSADSLITPPLLPNIPRREIGMVLSSIREELTKIKQKCLTPWGGEVHSKQKEIF